MKPSSQQLEDDKQQRCRIMKRLIGFGVCLLAGAGIVLGPSTRELSSRTAAGGAVAAPPPPRSGAIRCDNVAIADSLYRSQSGEDKHLLQQYFGGLCGGTYIELGALDGVLFSNSHVFNRALNWTGVLIELGPRNYKNLEQNRKNEIAVVHAAICETRRAVHYVEKGPVGGVVEFAAQSFKQQWWKGGEAYYQEVECLPMNDLLEERVAESHFFDFLSLDVEGAEFEVVKTLNFARYKFGVIVVEADKHNERKNIALKTHLVANGYSFEQRIADNYWFVNQDFHAIYAHLLH